MQTLIHKSAVKKLENYRLFYKITNVFSRCFIFFVAERTN